VVRTVHKTADPTVGTILRTWIEQYLQLLILCWHNFKNIVRAINIRADLTVGKILRT